jgi:hypothetical protein
MPVRSLNSRVLKWPDRSAVDAAVRHWGAELRRRHSEIVHIGYFGSYARGDWGVGSDVDLIIVVARAEEPFERRAALWRPARLPVPADVFVYTLEEWQSLAAARGRFVQTLQREAVWL